MKLNSNNWPSIWKRKQWKKPVISLGTKVRVRKTLFCDACHSINVPTLHNIYLSISLILRHCFNDPNRKEQKNYTPLLRSWLILKKTWIIIVVYVKTTRGGVKWNQFPYYSQTLVRRPSQSKLCIQIWFVWSIFNF